MTTALTEKPVIGPGEWGVMRDQAAILVKTGFLPPSVKTPEQVIAIALTGRELGIGTMEAIRGINVIQGKPSVSPQLMLALARRTGEVERFSIHSPGKPGTQPDASGAECHIKRRGSPEHVTIFGPAEAKALQLEGKDNYKKQAGTMYQWRAIAANLRVTFPDAISGLYTPDELGADVTVNDEGEMSVASSPAESQAIAMPKEKPADAEWTTGPDIRITDSERAMLFKLARLAWGPLAEENLRKFIKAKFGTEHTSDLTTEQYGAAIAELKDIPSASQSGPTQPEII